MQSDRRGAGAAHLPGLAVGERKVDGDGFLQLRCQSGKDSGASGGGLCPGAWERLCGPFKAVLLLWKYF